MGAGVPIKRKLLYFIAVGIIPLLLAIFYFFSEQESISMLSSTLETVQEQAILTEKKQSLNNAVRLHYKDADHFYIDKQLETLAFLEPEIESLQNVVSNRNFTEDVQIRKRLEFLTNGNTLVFSEGVVQAMPTFQETLESLVHPVEVNIDDIKKILAKVEGVTIGNYTPGLNRPQLIIIDFKLDKKQALDNNEVFQLDLKLLKREFL